MIVVQSQVMGYCNGVARVIEMAEETLRIAQAKNLPAYSIGWFIHNPTVVERFEKKGMQHIESPDEGPPGVALVRAHGIGDPLRDAFEKQGFILVDGTCGIVAYSQRMIRGASSSKHIVIVGLKGHSEVLALSNVWDAGKQIIPVHVVETLADIEALPSFEREEIMLMVQTTFPQTQYNMMRDGLRTRYQERLSVGNRLCPTTFRRHLAVIDMCKKVDAVIVVGGKASANTTSLVHLVETRKLPVWHVESAAELPLEIYTYARVGVTAGTSTPPEDIETVVALLERGGS